MTVTILLHLTQRPPKLLEFGLGDSEIRYFNSREVKGSLCTLIPSLPRKKHYKEGDLRKNTICFPIYKQLHMIYSPACLLHKQHRNLQDHKVRGLPCSRHCKSGLDGDSGWK